MLRSWSENTAEKKKLIAAFASALVLTFFPKTTTPVLFRLPKKPMTIHVTREVPPREAFDDLFYAPEVDQEWNEIKKSPSTNLNEQNNQASYNWSPEQAGQKRVFLPTLTFNKQMLVDGGSALAGEDSAWIAALPNSERTRLQEADDRSQVMSQDWTMPSWRSFATEKINQARAATSYPSSKIYVAATTPSGNIATPASYQMADVHLLSAKPTHFSLAGNLRLAAGLALGDRTLEVRRFVDGVPVEAGKISTEKGTFSIEVENLEGIISAELSDKDGTILASGNHRMVEGEDLRKIDLELTAKSQFAGTFVNFNRDPTKLISEKLSSTRGEPAEILYASLGVQDRTDALGSFLFPKVSESSFGIIRARAKGFADSLMILSAGEPKGIALVPNALISALKEIINGTKAAFADGNGIVWGQILFDGKPISGVSVTLSDDPQAKAIYLNGFIPQADLTETADNGYFIFSGLSKGMHTVLASRNGTYFGHLNLEVDDDAVTTGNLEATTKHQTIQVKVYDAFEGSPQTAQVQLQSLSDSVAVLGQIALTLPQLQRLSFGYVQPDSADYLPYQFSYSDADDFIHMPLIKTTWIDSLNLERRVTAEPNTGTVVGFVPEDDFQAYLSHEEKYDSANVVYFDAQGKVSLTGSAGGGFIMFNVPQGTQTIVVMSKKTEMLSTQIIPVENTSNNVLKFRF